jgi:hypothetical protein
MLANKILNVFKMKILVLLFVLVSCASSEESVSPSFAATGANSDASLSPIFNTWKLVSFEDSKTIKYEISLEIKPVRNEKGLFAITGKSTVNFYYAFFEADFLKSTLKIDGVSGTKIGTLLASEANFEKDYWERLAAVEKFEVSADKTRMTLFLPDITKKKLNYQISK